MIEIDELCNPLQTYSQIYEKSPGRNLSCITVYHFGFIVHNRSEMFSIR
jgi:hypothetical protein